MIIKVVWTQLNEAGGKMYHMYSAQEYAVDHTADDEVNLYLDNGKHHILIGPGDVAYAMNDNGKTIEVILTNRSPLTS
jgi:hypothetical protein